MQLVSKHRIMFKSGFILEQGNNDVPDDEPEDVKRFISDLIKHHEAYVGEDPSQPSAASRANGIEGVTPPDGEIQTEAQRDEANRAKAAMDEHARREQKRDIEKLAGKPADKVAETAALEGKLGENVTDNTHRSGRRGPQ